MSGLVVMKFGGTSLGSAERMRVAARLAADESRKRPVALVVSAMSKITDLLLDTMRHAEAGDHAGIQTNMAALRSRHEDACRELLPETRQAAVQGAIHSLLSEFERIVNGMAMLNERPPRSVDEAVAVGERLSALLVSEYLNSQGILAAAINAWEVVVTDAVFGNASPLMEPTREKARARLLPLLERRMVPVITGFNGATADGRPTTLGRGGSDFSASILAAALDAAEVWIWTDVDGIMSADPRLVSNVVVLEEVTYAEAAELAYNGAKVLHPRTLAPLVEKHIPVWSKNSFAPEKVGTKIVPAISAANGARAVTSMAKVALVSLEPASAELTGVQVMARAIDAIARVNVEVMALSSSSYRQSFCFLVRAEELERTLEALETALALELAHGYVKPIHVDNNVGLLAVVGEGMQGKPGLAGRIFTAISREQVNIIAIAQGSSELTIAIVVRRDGLEKAVRAVHQECGLGRG
jgi:aspartate kinase